MRSISNKKCIDCGLEVTGKHKRCVECKRLRHNELGNAFKDDMRAAGRCRDCGSFAAFERLYCESCAKNQSKFEANKRWTSKLNALQKISGLQMPKCIGENCGITDIRLLTINHHLKHDRINPTKLYREINKNKISTDDLDVRCYNCQILYEYQRGRLKCPAEFLPLNTLVLQGVKYS